MWQALTATPFSWAEWWPELIELGHVDLHADMVGTRFSCTWRASAGYKLHCDFIITGITYPTQVQFRSSGDLVGTASWSFSGSRRHTEIHIDWQVVTTKWWMNRLAIILKPIFIYNHNRLMSSGERGLESFLSTK